MDSSGAVYREIKAFDSDTNHNVVVEITSNKEKVQINNLTFDRKQLQMIVSDE